MGRGKEAEKQTKAIC